MIIMQKTATKQDVVCVVDTIEHLGFRTILRKESNITVIGILGNGMVSFRRELLKKLPGVDRVVSFSSPYKLTSRWRDG